MKGSERFSRGRRCAAAGARVPRGRSCVRIPHLPDDTRLWAALVQASGGVWGGCVYDADAIVAQLQQVQRLSGETIRLQIRKARTYVKLYRTTKGIFVEDSRQFLSRCRRFDWDELIAQRRICTSESMRRSRGQSAGRDSMRRAARADGEPGGLGGGGDLSTAAAARAWRSRKDAGGGTFYDRVYTAERPELFFKATGRRVVGPGGAVRIRSRCASGPCRSRS